MSNSISFFISFKRFVTHLALMTLGLIISVNGLAQEKNYWKVSVQAHKSMILRPTDEVAHLIISHPTGLTLQANRKSTGVEGWQKAYNYPDRGYTLKYLNYRNDVLGKSIAIMPHYRFYFLEHQKASQLTFRTGLGIAYNTNAYDTEKNNKNNLLSTTLGYAMDIEIGYSRKIGSRFDAMLGVTYTHLSNASFRRPNSGVNLMSTNIGIQYQLYDQKPEYSGVELSEKTGFAPMVGFASGFSEAQVVGSGTFPFYVAQIGIEYRFNDVSAISLGTEAFWTLSLREDINFPTDINNQGDLDYRRMSINLGHELFIGKTSFMIQVGHYYYRPYNAFKRFYQRYGLRHYFSPALFGSFSIKTHYGNTEAAEFGIGYKWSKK